MDGIQPAPNLQLNFQWLMKHYCKHKQPCSLFGKEKEKSLLRGSPEENPIREYGFQRHPFTDLDRDGGFIS